jgi:hypothetical protein
VLTGSAQTTLRVFTSTDGVFQFKYSAVLVDCTKLAPTQPPASGVPQVFVGYPPPLSIPDSCRSQAGVCSDLGDQARTLACFAYPNDKFKNKPSFTAAMFFVDEIEQATTEKACLRGSENWDSAEIEKARLRKINGITFKVFEIADNWMSGGQWGPVYRTFHDNKCYELGIQTAMVLGGYDSETLKRFTQKDNDEVQGRLNEAVNSFIFVK